MRVIFAQEYRPITALSGSEVVGGNAVNVTNKNGMSNSFCAVSPYWIGFMANSSYSFTFSLPVLSIRVRLSAMNKGEVISFSVNGVPYNLTPINLIEFGAGSCKQDQAIIFRGELMAPETMQSYNDYAGAEINITDYRGISSITVAENVPRESGTVFNLFISTDSIKASYNDPLCIRDTLKLSAISSIVNASFSWTGPAGFSSILQNPAIPNVTPANAGNYVVIASDGVFMAIDTLSVEFLPSPEQPFVSYPETICGTALKLSATTMPAGADYEWFGPDSFHSLLQNPVILNAVERNGGLYTVLATIGSCRSLPNVVDVSLLKAALSIHNTDTLVCQGALIALSSIATPGYSYHWSPSSGLSDSSIPNPMLSVDESLTYMLTASYPGCPDTSLNFRVEMEENPVVQLGLDKEVCQGVDVALESVVTPYQNDYIYQWEPSGSLFSTPISANTGLVADSTRQYVLTVFSPLGCLGNDTIEVAVHSRNFGRIVADTGFCLPDTVGLWASGGASYAWTPATGLDDTTIASPQANPATTTFYTAYIANEYGCTDSLSVWVHVYSNAVLQLLDSLKIYSGEKFHLKPETNCSYFEWFPPSGISDVHSSNPLLYPEVRTRFFVTAKTTQGCSVFDSIDVMVECGAIDLANAFNPSSGGRNMLFGPSERGHDDIRLKQFVVFNRWGNKIFETHEFGKGWDGKYNGIPQPMGVYLYRVEGENKCGNFSKTGQVTLLR